ncbi:MAG: DNA-binding response regulator [Chloroflexota bacterium]|nr:MAG: DNA-binding response regulator [Chloroflexota bacterium]
MKILIVDDHALFREGLVSLFKSQKDFEVVGEAGTAEMAVRMAAALQPDLILMDIHLPDASGIDAVKRILTDYPDIMIVMLTAHESEALLFKAITYGAKGYLLKNTPISTLLPSLRGLMKGEAALSRTMTAQVLEQVVRLGNRPTREDIGSLDKLTQRERDVLRELSKGASNQEIAQRLVISENTVKIHVHNILEKLNLPNRRAASRFAPRAQSFDYDADPE